MYLQGLEGFILHESLSCATEPNQPPALTNAPYFDHMSKTSVPIAFHVWIATTLPNAIDEPRFAHQYRKDHRSTPQFIATHYSPFALLLPLII